jgi:hypothetical protein
MSCNSCSNITLPGVVGPAGAAGSNGSNGADGDHIVVLKVYKRASSTPAQPGASSYDFSTLTLTPPAGWSTSVPSGTDPCYVSHGTASVTPPATVDSSITWTNPPEIAFENGADGVSIIEIDTALGGGTTSQTSPTTPQKSFNIPANTWQNDGDMVELEIMAVGELFQDGFHKIYITIGSAPVPIDLDALFTAALASGYVGCEARIEPFMHLKLQLSMSSVGTITPITDFQAGGGIYSVESTNPLSTAGYLSKHRGANLTGVPVSGIVPIDVYMVSVDGTVSVKLFYFKLTSYKA